jgi:hypothetical protein
MGTITFGNKDEEGKENGKTPTDKNAEKGTSRMAQAVRLEEEI